MAEKPTTPPDGNILVFVEDYEGGPEEAALRRYAAVYEGQRCEAESTSSAEQPYPGRHHGYIAPPYGWKRLLTNGLVIYISPSNTALSSTEQVKAYLLAEGTCKCGLECPVNCETTFNFNPKVLTRPWTAPVIGPSDLNKLCNHKRKLLAQTSVDSLDNKYDGFRKKKKKFVPSLPHGLLSQGDQELKDQEKNLFNGLPWRANNSQEHLQESYSNGYQPKYELPSGTAQFPHKDGENKFGCHPQPSPQNQVAFEQRSTYSSNVYENKLKHSEFSQQETQQTPLVHSVLPTNLNVNRTPPWQQNKFNPLNTYERVPPLHPHTVTASVWSNDMKKKQSKFIQKKRYPEEGPNSSSSTPEPPSFLEDPSGYLAQQTALLNSTISRQSTQPVDGISLPSNINRFSARPKCNKTLVTSRFPDSSIERRKFEEPSSTLPDKNVDDRGPIQGTTVSTSNRSPVEGPPENIVTTMASGHTQSSNTITSVLAGKANTATVSINTQGMHQKSQQGEEKNSPQQEDVRQILVSSPGQLVVANSMLPGQSKPVISQPTVLLPGSLLLQPTSVVVDGLNTAVQIPQIVGNVVQNQVIEDTSLLSPDSKRKSNLKKRKLSPVGSMLLSPGSNNVMVQQQQINTPMLQALTILPGKTGFAGTQQLIATNMLQPLNLVQNFPIQQFIVPAGVGSMVMSDGTILQDTVQLNLLTPVQNTGVFSSNGQNLLAPGMVIRTPNSQSNNKVLQNNQFLGSPNHQYVVNNTFGGPVSPMLSVSPNTCNRNQDFLPQNLVVQQPSSSNSTIVQQNTTIVQQTTMVSNHQTQPTHTLNLNQNFILNEKPNFILTSDKQNFILSPNSGDKIVINPENIRGNFVLGNIDKPNFLINNAEKQNLIINNFDKSYLVEKKNSVSTQTQVASPGIYRESPPDTTTLSPVDQEVTTSLQPTSPESLPMVHCVSSSSHHDDQPFSVDNYMSHIGKSTYSDSSCLTVQTTQDKDDNYRRKMSLINVPDNTNLPDDETISSGDLVAYGDTPVFRS